MEVNESVPILCMCRLCLKYSGNFTEIGEDESEIHSKIKKYLCIEINDDDQLPRTVCRECIDRIQVFDEFCCKVAHHQQLLQLTKSSEVNETQINALQLAKGTETLIITLQTTSAPDDSSEPMLSSPNDVAKESNVNCINEYRTERIIGDCFYSTSIPISSISIERELDDLADDEIKASDAHTETDNEDAYDEIESVNDTESSKRVNDFNINHEQYKDFPAKIIAGCKLLYKGRDLLEMISKFYRLECDQCQDKPRFEHLSVLFHHFVDCHKMKGYVMCCNVKLIKPRAMALHMARHLQPNAFKCPECNKMLTCPKILQYHMQNHLPESERPLACVQCPRRFSYSSALVAHAISHQPEDQRVAHVCDECGKIFASAGRLTTHINVSHMLNGQDFICHICSKKFACRSNLTYHLTTHQPKVRQIQCSLCNKWLKNKLCLRKHMVQHSTVRYSCTMCNYSALNGQCLKNHMRVQHTNDKPFSCDVCGKAFKLKNTLANHSVQHTGVRKFVCPFCNRTFASSGNFYSHRKRMHPEELYAMKLKQEEDERRLREQTQKTKT